MDEPSEGSQKLLQGLVSHERIAYHSVFDLFLNQWIMAILPKECNPDNFESHNSLTLSFTDIHGFSLIKLSWHSGSISDKLGWLNWF